MLNNEGRLRPEVIEGFVNLCYIQKSHDKNFHCVMLDSAQELSAFVGYIKANITEFRSPYCSTVILFCTTYNLHICRMHLSKQHSDVSYSFNVITE